MPKLRQPANDPFKRLSNAMWPYVIGEEVKHVARVLGVSRDLLYRRRSNPKKFTLEEIDMLQRICDIPKPLIAEHLPWHCENDLTYSESEIVRYIRAFPEVKEELLARIAKVAEASERRNE